MSERDGAVEALRTAAERLAYRAEAALDCYYGGREKGCEHRPPVMESVAEVLAALAAAAAPPALRESPRSVSTGAGSVTPVGTAPPAPPALDSVLLAEAIHHEGSMCVTRYGKRDCLGPDHRHLAESLAAKYEYARLAQQDGEK